jgi:CubicO group peptidase (beta-lactamase class C family)
MVGSHARRRGPDRGRGWHGRCGHRQTMHADNSLSAASVNKQFLAAAAMMLVEDHELALGDTITGWLPTLPAHRRWQDITGH